MNAADRLILARKIAAAACTLTGCTDEYCRFMREGAYDDDSTVLAALGALKTAEHMAANEPKPNVVELAA